MDSLISDRFRHNKDQHKTDPVGVFDYIFGIFAAFFFGISNTVVTVIGYKHGNRSFGEIKAMLKRGIILMLIGGVLMFALCEIFAEPFAGLFMGV